MSQMMEVLEHAVSTGTVAGVAAAAATRDGVVFEAGCGHRDVATGAAMTFDSLFRIASMTKAITSVAILQLVERGVLDLDADAGSALPALASPEVLEGFDEKTGEPMLRPAAGPITLRQLLTHTAGFAYEMWNPEIVEYAARKGVPSILAGGDGFLEAPLVYDPGTRWCYSTGTDWLGRLVEHVSGHRLDQFFREHILDPLGMNDTTFSLREDEIPRLASVYARQGDGSLVAAGLGAPMDVKFLSGGGGLVSTAADYLQFLRTILCGGELDGVRILQLESVAMMSRNQIGPLLHEPMITTQPAVSNDVDLFPGIPKKWGLGFMINTEPIPGGRAAGSLAWAGIYNSHYWIDPARGVCAVLLTQTLPFCDPGVIALLAEFERAVYASLPRG